jgi:hypothetical protein
MAPVSERRGTWREPNGEKVAGADARSAWADAARPVLLHVARKYGDYVTYKELSERVQHDTKIHTTQRMDYWIGKVLGEVSADAARRGEPLLSAFCVHADETVGLGYASAVFDAYGVTPDDPDVHAAEERLKAHRYYGAELPPDGGHARLPPGIARRRANKKAAQPRLPRKMCPNCFVELPVSGRCGFCDE